MLRSSHTDQQNCLYGVWGIPIAIAYDGTQLESFTTAPLFHFQLPHKVHKAPPL